MIRHVAASFALFLLFSPSVSLAQDAEAGAAVFRKCAACHNAESTANKVGPHLQDIVGRVAGSLEGYNYSKAMKDAGAAGLVWDESALGEYLVAPKDKVPGTKMVFPGLKKPEEVENVIAYLMSVSE